jgi:hypothetical protein
MIRWDEWWDAAFPVEKLQKRGSIQLLVKAAGDPDTLKQCVCSVVSRDLREHLSRTHGVVLLDSFAAHLATEGRGMEKQPLMWLHLELAGITSGRVVFGREVIYAVEMRNSRMEQELSQLSGDIAAFLTERITSYVRREHSAAVAHLECNDFVEIMQMNRQPKLRINPYGRDNTPMGEVWFYFDTLVDTANNGCVVFCCGLGRDQFSWQWYGEHKPVRVQAALVLPRTSIPGPPHRVLVSDVEPGEWVSHSVQQRVCAVSIL